MNIEYFSDTDTLHMAFFPVPFLCLRSCLSRCLCRAFPVGSVAAFVAPKVMISRSKKGLF